MAATGTSRAQEAGRARMNSGPSRGASPTPGGALHVASPRLLALPDAARYLGLSSWTTRKLEWRGVLQRVRVPRPGGASIRKVLFDKADLDGLIDAWKDARP